MTNYNELINELFPIKIYEDKYYPARLSVNEKIYLALYENAERDIRKVDAIMIENISRPTLNKIKKHLSTLHLINIKTKQNMTSEEAKSFTILNSHLGKKCDWCGKESYILQKHHYPIPKAEGGIHTVNICPNCHYTYHAIIGENL